MRRRSSEAVQTTSRRELLGAAVGAAAAAAALGPARADAAAIAGGGPQVGGSEQDLRVLERLLEAEHLLGYAYTRVLGSHVLKTAAEQVVLQADRYHQEHLAAVLSHIRALHASLPPQAPPGRTSAKHPPPGRTSAKHPPPGRTNAKHPPPFPPRAVSSLFKTLHTESDAIKPLIEVESLVLARYFNAVAELSEPDVIRTTTQILACKAQQWSLLQDMYTRGGILRTVPTAFVRGSSSLGRG